MYHSVIILVAAVASIPFTVSYAATNEACPLLCYNNGECAAGDIPGDFHCECPMVRDDNGLQSSFTGTRCETPSVACEEGAVSYQCLNGSSCNMDENSCVCTPGFEGNFCEFGPSTCMYGGVCYNGGKCNDRHNKKEDKCNCPSGTKGERCETLIEGMKVTSDQTGGTTEATTVLKNTALTEESSLNVPIIVGVAVAGAFLGVAVTALIARRISIMKENNEIAEKSAHSFQSKADSEIA